MNETKTETYEDRANMSSAEYERDIEHTREEIDHTLHSLEERLSPRELWNRTVDEWGGNVKDFSGNMGRSIRDNPLPATLLGISLVWLMAAGSDSGPKYRLRSGSSQSAGEKVRGRYGEMKSRAEEMKSRAGQLKSRAGDFKARAGDKMDEMGDKMHHMSEEMKQRRDRLRQRGEEISHRLRSGGGELAARPMLLTAAGLALGSLIALSLPMTRKEREMMGEHGEELLEKAKNIGREKLEEGKEAAGAAGEAAGRTFMDEVREKETGSTTEQDAKSTAPA